MDSMQEKSPGKMCQRSLEPPPSRRAIAARCPADPCQMNLTPSPFKQATAANYLLNPRMKTNRGVGGGEQLPLPWARLRSLQPTRSSDRETKTAPVFTPTLSLGPRLILALQTAGPHLWAGRSLQLKGKVCTRNEASEKEQNWQSFIRKENETS